MAFLAVASAAVSAIGTIAGGVASRNQANYQAAVASNNSTIAQENAVRTEQAGNIAAENQGRKGSAKVAGIKVAQAANGVDVNSGSALDVQTGQRETDKLDTETVLSNSELQAYGYRTQAAGFQSEAQLDENKADAAIPASIFSATGSLLSSASSVGGKWTGSVPNVPGFNPIAGASGQ